MPNAELGNSTGGRRKFLEKQGFSTVQCTLYVMVSSLDHAMKARKDSALLASSPLLCWCAIVVVSIVLTTNYYTDEAFKMVTRYTLKDANYFQGLY